MGKNAMWGALVGAGLVCAQAPAWAGGYAGGALAYSQIEGDDAVYEDFEEAVGLSGFFGYRFDMPVPVFLEADYTDSGELDEEQSDVSLRFRGPSVFAGAYVPLDRAARFRLWGKVGYAQVSSEVRAEFEDEAGQDSGIDFIGEDNDGFVWALGGDFEVARSLAVRVEYRQYGGLLEGQNAGLPPGAPDFEADLRTARVGLVLAFGGSESAAPSAPAPAAPARSTYIPPAALISNTPPPVEPPPATAPPAPPVRLAADRGRTRAPTPLTDRPVPGDRPITMIPAGEIVQVQNRVPNKDGVWYFVQFAGQTGWVPAESLDR